MLPYLISFYINIIIKDVLVCLTFFQKQSTRAGCKDSSEVYEYIQISLYEFTVPSEQSKENDVFRCGFLRTLVTCQKYMQSIYNLREAD